MVVPADTVFVLPDNMSLEDAAAIPVNYITAYIMLFDQVVLREGQSVFVHMAAGKLISCSHRQQSAFPNFCITLYLDLLARRTKLVSGKS